MKMALKGLHRFIRYYLVGLMGLGMKFSVLAALIEFARLGYMIATAIAVEATVLHNFVWHLFWTWRERSDGISYYSILIRLVRFHIATGAVALASNLILMRLLVDRLGVHYFPSNLIATCAAGLSNFFLSEFFVFATHSREACRNTAEGKIRGRPTAAEGAL